MSALTRRLRQERGAELIEFALVFPLLLMVVLAMVDFGFMFQRMEVVTNAAREGARLAVLPGYDQTDVEERVESYLEAGGVAALSNTQVFVDMDHPIPAAAGPMAGKRVEVVYNHQYLFLGPVASWFGGSFSSVPVRGVAVMRDEAAPYEPPP
jgi:hypothetical protein